MNRKALIREQENTPQPMRVYWVRNTVNGKVFIGTGHDLPGVVKSQRVQLRFGSHMNRDLPCDWNALGLTCPATFGPVET